MKWLVLLGLAACGDSASAPVDAAHPDVLDGDGLVSLDPMPARYEQTCDGSGALALDFTHFLNVNDDDQTLGIYERARSTPPVQTIDLNPALGLTASDEADLEDLERIGDRVFATASHGRTAAGVLDRARYKLAAFDLAGTAPNVTLTAVGTSNLVLDQMLVAANWDVPDAAVIAALAASSQLGDPSATTLAPENSGTNIEALATDGTGVLLLGFRNPRPGNRALVVSLVNPDAAVTGSTARFGGAVALDLAGLGIRGMTYSPAHAAVLLIAGPHDGAAGPFALYKWSGDFAAAPRFVGDIIAPPQAAPEAVVPYPDTKDVQIIFDGGDTQVGTSICKAALPADRGFRDAIRTVD